MSLKHDNYIKDRKNVTIFLGEEIKMNISQQSSAAIQPQANVRTHTVRQETLDKPLLKAFKSNNVDELRRLINDGINVNVIDEFGMTPLHHAVRYGHANIVQVLLDNGVNVNAKNSFG